MYLDDEIDFEHNSPVNWRELTPDQPDIIDLNSVEEIKSCAEQGDSKAQHYLAVLYTQGTVLTQNFSPLMTVFEFQSGSTSAMRSLAFLYKQGRGVNACDRKCFEWCSKAAMRAMLRQ